MSEETKKVEMPKWVEYAIVAIIAIAGAFGLEYAGVKDFVGEIFSQTDAIVVENEYYIEKIEGGVIYLRDRFGNRKTAVEVDAEEVEEVEVE